MFAAKFQQISPECIKDNPRRAASLDLRHLRAGLFGHLLGKGSVGLNAASTRSTKFQDNFEEGHEDEDISNVPQEPDFRMRREWRVGTDPNKDGPAALLDHSYDKGLIW